MDLLFTHYDYLVLGFMFIISFAIGLYYAYEGRKSVSSKEYFTASGNVGIIPATFSLLASILCTIWYVGMPTEVYFYGFHYLIDLPILTVMLIVSGFAFMPVFYELQVTSATEYLEKRFNKLIRLLGAFLYLFNSVIFTSLVMYIPALAISKVMGINIWASILAMCIVGTAYTALGGIRAVMWTDVFQTIIIYTSLMAIAIKGTIDVGGFGVVWERGVEGKRISIAPFSIDPRYRYSLFWMIITEVCYWLGFYGTYQTQIQRYLSCPSIQDARKAIWINIPGLIFIESLIIYIGLILYASFYQCDPVMNGKIEAADEILIYFVMKTFKNMPGMTGLFVAGIFSGALSTVSSCLNSMAAVTVEDFCSMSPKFQNFSSKRKTDISKWIATFYGILTLILMILAEKVDSIISFCWYNNGAVFGINFSLFILGLFCPWANSVGAFCGFVASVAFGLFVSIGGQISETVFEPAPLSTAMCHFNISANQTDFEESFPILFAQDLSNNGGLNELFKISPINVLSMTFLVSITVAFFCSKTYDLIKKNNEIPNTKHYSPLIRKWIKRKWVNKQDMEKNRDQKEETEDLLKIKRGFFPVNCPGVKSISRREDSINSPVVIT